jgi:hypothetical protein
MKLSDLASRYVAYKQDMGMRFHTEARTLKSFCRTMGDVAMAEITPDRVLAYIAGTGPVTRFWHRKYEVPPRPLPVCCGTWTRGVFSASQDHSCSTGIRPSHLLA